MQMSPWQIAGIALSVLAAGCSYTPSRVEMPTIEAQEAGLAAVEYYDEDGDGLLSPEELTKVPGILGSLGKYDADQNGKVSAEEISERIRGWQAVKVGMQPFFCRVRLDGRPFEGAEVKFVPEAFLGSDIKPARGIANSKGAVNMGIDTSDLPKDQRTLIGVQSGVYRIEVTHPTFAIPARYNSKTVLGVEVAPLENDLAELDLRSG